MSEPTGQRPSEAELAILQVLWERGPSTVRVVHEQLVGSRKTGYTTVLKLMQIMATKGLVERDESARSHVYHAKPERGVTQRRLVLDLIERAFGGSSRDLVLQALAAQSTTPAELAEIRAMLDQLEGERDAASDRDA